MWRGEQAILQLSQNTQVLEQQFEQQEVLADANRVSLEDSNTKVSGNNKHISLDLPSMALTTLWQSSEKAQLKTQICKLEVDTTGIPKISQ